MAQAGVQRCLKNSRQGLADGGKRPLPTQAATRMSPCIQLPVKESSSSDDGIELGAPQPGRVQRRDMPDFGASPVMPGTLALKRRRSGPGK